MEVEREEMPCDVLFVGGGPANLAGAIHLMNLVESHNEAVAAGGEGEEIDEPMIVLVDKGSELGAHQLSGAVLDPRALTELIPDWKTTEGFPIERFVETEDMVFLTKGSHISAPWLPPEIVNLGKPIVSLGRLCAWLGEIAEEKGVNIFSGFAGTELLYDGDKVIGVRTGDRGVDKDGGKKDNFEAGYDLPATVTILGEGPRGNLTKKLIDRHNLDANCNPMAYEVGCKEVIELPEGTIKEGYVYHSIGYPLDMNTFGGSFLYSLSGDRVCIGMLVATDAQDPMMDCHLLLQKLKMHPFIKSKIGTGKVVKYGAKAVSIGGWASQPQLFHDGVMIVGDGGSFLNPMRIKGIHLSMKTGMLAAETAFECMKTGEAPASALAAYKQRIDDSWIRTEMEPATNMHANFSNGLVGGLVKTGAQYFFGPGPTKSFPADHTHMHTLEQHHRDGYEEEKLEYDNVYLMDKLTSVYNSGTQHDEDQPCHLKITDTEICATTCLKEYGNPCTKFCPAQVYNMVPNEENNNRLEMQVDFGNCVHCKTCDIRDPYQIITWVPPEGGNGPEYGFM